MAEKKDGPSIAAAGKDLADAARAKLEQCSIDVIAMLDGFTLAAPGLTFAAFSQIRGAAEDLARRVAEIDAAMIAYKPDSAANKDSGTLQLPPVQIG